jgi:predicted exporter
VSLERTTRRLAWLWLVLVLVCVAHNGWYWLVQRHAPVTDMLAMLPKDEQRPQAAQATQALADAGARRVTVLVGGGERALAERAADAFVQALGDVPARRPAQRLHATASPMPTSRPGWICSRRCARAC